MNSQFEILERMQEYEEIFLEELQNNKVILLRDIKITKDQLNEIAKNIRQIYKSRNTKALEKRFPLTTSLFLVWSGVYDYNDGELWPKIFKNLKVPQNIKIQQVFGEIFLKALRKYELQPVISTDSKKYLSPILMHGYISDFYSQGFFDYLNRVYTVLLDGDVSESAIENIWGDIFSEDNQSNSLNSEISDLKKNIKYLDDEKNSYSIPDEILSLEREEVYTLERYVENILSEINIEEEIINRAEIRYGKMEQALKYQYKLENSLEIINNTDSNIIDFEEKKEINEFSYELKKNIDLQIGDSNQRIDESKKSIKKYNNILMIQEEKLKDINMSIATIGKGSLEEGWLTLEDYKNLDLKINRLTKTLKNKEKLYQLSNGFQNTSLKQILTSSLSHLHRSNSEYFKSFIIRTFQMMDGLFKDTEVDKTYPLYDPFIQWYESYDNRKIETSITEPREISDKNENLQLKKTDINKDSISKRLQIKRLTKPYLSLNINSGTINLNIPEQSFDTKDFNDIRPNYILEDEEGIIVELEPSIMLKDKKVYINETRISINKVSEQRLLFNWINLRESFSIDLEPIMIFNKEGKILNTNRLNNGLYYIFCSNRWYTKDPDVIDVANARIEGCKIYEIQIDEGRVVFSNDKSIVELIGSDYSSIELSKLNIVEGITLDRVKVVTGTMPDLVIGLKDINPADYTLKIFVDETLLHDIWLGDVINSKVTNNLGLSCVINLGKLIKLRGVLISRLKIVVEKINKIISFEEEFYIVLKTKFIYINKGLSIEIAPCMRFNHHKAIQNSMEYWIPLSDEKGEKFDMYFDKVGWKSFQVEVPKIEMTITDGEGRTIDNLSNLLVTEIHKIKNYKITWETDSNIPKIIILSDKNKDLESRLHLKGGKVTTSLNPYYDIFNDVESKSSLNYHWEGGIRKVDSRTIFNIYKKWNINDIKVFQKESEDEFILELKLEFNFNLNGDKKLRVFNENNIILEKKLKENQIYIYIKKEDINTLNLRIEIVYLEHFNDIFGQGTREVIAGQREVKLISKIYEIQTILRNGISSKGFKYEGDNYNFKNPFVIDNIIKAEPINFIKEELYMGSARFDNKEVKVLFYINLERNILPFLLDLDRDGAQYHPETGEVFWDSRTGKEIMGPIEDVIYDIKGE